jgi:diguanylate cyclase (GGDEF)-like protein
MSMISLDGCFPRRSGGGDKHGPRKKEYLELTQEILVTKRDLGLRATRMFVFAYGIVTIFQLLTMLLWGRFGALNWAVALASMLVNCSTLLFGVAYLVGNNLAVRRGWDQARVYVLSTRALLAMTLVAWWLHIHIAGTPFTLLALLIPTTAVVTAWLLDEQTGWLYLVVGSAGLVVMLVAESTGALTFMPIIDHAQDQPMSFFLGSRYGAVHVLMYFAFAIVTMQMLLRLQRDLTRRNEALSAASRKLEVLAMTDPLTALFNRRTIMDMINKELSRSARRGTRFSVVMADIDNFKTVNDTFGHDAGDRVLREIATLLAQNFRPYDIVGRFGGEEFLVVIKDTNLEEGRALAERTRASIADRTVPLREGASIRVTVSFGCTAVDPDHPQTVDKLLRRADEALYESKKAGKNRVTAKA